jgi:hypothetical protein
MAVLRNVLAKSGLMDWSQMQANLPYLRHAVKAVRHLAGEVGADQGLAALLKGDVTPVAHRALRGHIRPVPLPLASRLGRPRVAVPVSTAPTARSVPVAARTAVVRRPVAVTVAQRPAPVTVRPLAPPAREVLVPAHPLVELGPRRVHTPGFVDLNPFTDLRVRG